LRLATDATWKCANTELPGWDAVDYDESGWTNALVIGKAGGPPWNKFESLSNVGVYAPQSSGIPGIVRLIYAPEPQTIIVRNLGSKENYRAAIFDPVTGEKTALQAICADENGYWSCSPPPAHDHDWVIALENATVA
jgi:hypothetical protein